MRSENHDYLPKMEGLRRQPIPRVRNPQTQGVNLTESWSPNATPYKTPFPVSNFFPTKSLKYLLSPPSLRFLESQWVSISYVIVVTHTLSSRAYIHCQPPSCLAQLSLHPLPLLQLRHKIRRLPSALSLSETRLSLLHALYDRSLRLHTQSNLPQGRRA